MLIYSFLFFKLLLAFGLDFELGLGLMLGLEFGLGLGIGGHKSVNPLITKLTFSLTC